MEPMKPMEPMEPMKPMTGGETWWPDDLGQPATLAVSQAVEKCRFP